MKAKLDWKSFGLFFSTVLDLFTIIRGVFSKMKVGIEILPWLCGEGREHFAEQVLKPLGQKFLDVTKAAEAVTKDHLRRIPSCQSLKVRATTGQRLISKAKELFLGGVDFDFTNWSLNNIGQATGEVLADVWGMVQDSTFMQLF